MTNRPLAGAASFWGLAICLAVAFLGGCKKSNSATDGPGDTTLVVLTGADVTPKGTLNDAGTKKLEAQSGAAGISVITSRTRISDAALVQLAKYPNIRRVEAMGSPLSDAAIDQLKSSNPNIKAFLK